MILISSIFFNMTTYTIYKNIKPVYFARNRKILFIKLKELKKGFGDITYYKNE